MSRIHLAPERPGAGHDCRGFLPARPDTASITVAVVAVAAAPPIPVSITATIPLGAVAVPVAAVVASPVVPVAAVPVSVVMVMMADGEAETRVVAPPVPGPWKIPVRPAAIVAEDVVARRIVDPRHVVSVDRPIHVPVNRLRSVDGLFDDGQFLDHGRRRRDGFDHLDRLNDLDRRNCEWLPGLVGRDLVLDHDLANRSGGLGQQRRARLQDRHEKVQIQGAGEVDHPFNAGVSDIGCGNAHLVPRLGGPFGNVDGTGSPLVEEQLGAAAAPGTGNENDLAQVEVGRPERGPFIEQRVHVEILAPVDGDVLNRNLDADPVLLRIGFLRNNIGNGIWRCFGVYLGLHVLVARASS